MEVTYLVLGGAAAIVIPVLIYVAGGMLGLGGGKRRSRRTGSRPSTNGKCSHVTRDPNAPEVLIVGSGILGSAMATVLARDGRKVTVIERDLSEPDRIVGELMQPGGLKTLDDLGLGECLAGFDEVRLDGFVIFDPFTNKPLDFQYPKDETGAPLSSKCFHHGRFVMSMRKAAMAEKNVTYIEGTVTSLLEDGDRIIGVEYKRKGQQNREKITAPLTVVADGAFSKFRRQLTATKGGTPSTPTSYFIGFKFKETENFKPNHAEAFWCTSTPTMIYRIDSQTLRLMADINTSVQPKNPRQFVEENILPELPPHLQKTIAPAIQDEGFRFRLVPTYYFTSTPTQRPGVLLLGDALNMRHPFTAAGMTVAIKDLAIWRDILRKVDDLGDVDALVDAHDEFQDKRRSSYVLAINVFAQCIYRILVAKDRYLKKLRLGGYYYVLLGGECLNGPLRIYGGIEPTPALLLKHFIRVNLYTAYYIFKTAAWYAKPLALIDGPLIFIRSSWMFYSLWRGEACKPV